MPQKSTIKVNIAKKAKSLEENIEKNDIPSVVASRPAQKPVGEGSTPKKDTPVEVQVEKRSKGRPKTSIIDRKNGKTMFFEQDHNLKLDLIYAYDKLDRQDVIRCALATFLDKYLVDGSHLKTEAVELVNRYHEKTHVTAE